MSFARYFTKPQKPQKPQKQKKKRKKLQACTSLQQNPFDRASRCAAAATVPGSPSRRTAATSCTLLRSPGRRRAAAAISTSERGLTLPTRPQCQRRALLKSTTNNIVGIIAYVGAHVSNLKNKKTKNTQPPPKDNKNGGSFCDQPETMKDGLTRSGEVLHQCAREANIIQCRGDSSFCTGQALSATQAASPA